MCHVKICSRETVRRNKSGVHVNSMLLKISTVLGSEVKNGTYGLKHTAQSFDFCLDIILLSLELSQGLSICVSSIGNRDSRRS